MPSRRRLPACPTWRDVGSNGQKGRQMDLQVYYQKIRDMETKITDEFPLMVSMETADGGKGGTKTEVPRRLAAKLLVEGIAAWRRRTS